MKKRAITLLIFFSCFGLAVIALCVFSTQTILHGCLWWECAPDRNFHVRDWELSADFFPDGALVKHISATSDGSGEKERGSQTIFWSNGGALYSIMRYPSNQKAIFQYEFEVDHMADFRTKIPWEEPAQLTFYSTQADKTQIACGKGIQGTDCRFVGRYQEYVVYFASSIDEGMTFQDFEKILEYLDEQISSRLYP
jgi:hypothetical protein